MSTVEDVDRLFTMLLSSYSSLLMSGHSYMHNSAEAGVEAARSSVASSALHTAVAGLLGQCSALRMQSCMYEGLGEGEAVLQQAQQAQQLDVWAGITPAYLTSLLPAAVSAVTLSHSRTLEQSCTCVALVSWEEGGAPLPAAMPALPRHLFLKRASPSLLARAGGSAQQQHSAASLALHEQSFRNEQALQRALAGEGGRHHAALCAAGAPVPRCLAVAEEQGVFTSIVEHLEARPQHPSAAYQEVAVCDRAHAHAVLRWLAAFHAYWWGRPPPPGLHHPGGWWRRACKPEVDFGAIPRVFEGHCAAFASMGATLDTPGHRRLMQALPGQCEAMHARAASAQPNTLLHGDVKTSNAFFAKARGKAGSGAAAPPNAPGVPTLFDFQWCGSAGDGLADVAYFVAGGVAAGEVLQGGWLELLRVYHQALLQGLAARGVQLEGLPVAGWEGCRAAFERELVVYYTLAAPYLLDGLTPGAMEGNRRKYGWLTHEMEEPMLWWLTSTVLEALGKGVA